MSTLSMLLPSGNPIKCHEFLSLKPNMFPPKRFDIFPPFWGMMLRRFWMPLDLSLDNSQKNIISHSDRIMRFYCLDWRSLILLVGLFCLASRVEWERWALSISFVWHVACDVWLSGALFFWVFFFYFPIIACVLTFMGPFIYFWFFFTMCTLSWVVSLWPRKAFESVGPVRMLE